MIVGGVGVGLSVVLVVSVVDCDGGLSVESKVSVLDCRWWMIGGLDHDVGVGSVAASFDNGLFDCVGRWIVWWLVD